MKGKKTGGRKKGTLNRLTLEIRTVAAEFVDDPSYRAKLAKDFRARRVSPGIEMLFWYYAHGKPVERSEVWRPMDFDCSKLSDAELKAELQKALESIKDR
jgi:hypothetical protein